MTTQIKTCTKCKAPLPHASFGMRKRSPDGMNAQCKNCVNEMLHTRYWSDPAVRQKYLTKAIVGKRARFARDPAYHRAFRLWNNTQRRSKVPPWVCIVDFVPVCQEAIDAGPGYELDHIIPLKGKLVSGLHVPANMRVVPRETNWTKSNKFIIETLS